MSNHERVGKGLEALKSGLAPFVERELKARHGAAWWKEGVEPHLAAGGGGGGRRARRDGGGEIESLDVHALLSVLWSQWNEVFQSKLGHPGRTYASELRDVRNKWAHQEPFTVEDAHRALDTMTRFLQMIAAPQADDTGRLARDLLRLRFEEEAKREQRRGAEAVVQTGTPAGLKPWREIATPRADVATGRFRQAEFAADLSKVVSDDPEDAGEEYRSPTEFFRRTHLTEGLTHLLLRAIARLSAAGGDPVVELQTNFGGGKTHSLLALYHLFGGATAPGDMPGVDGLLARSGVKTLPVAKRAVLVGTRLNPATPWKKADGTLVHTMWGDLAWQLGKKKGYALVADADRKGVSPGSDTLKRLFEENGPALVLIDEWVTFARNLYGVEGLPAGSFDANMTFAQALTEAASRSASALVVVSIPSSDIEIGGDQGKAALERIRNTVRRTEAVWKPATAEESFEIVRRRLFEEIKDFAGRDAACRAFAEMYRDNRSEFPRDCAEAEYERRLRAAYPIHPELFDRLYQDWSTLERFQRTRGVLRLMAAVVHTLWERQDRSLMILPGTIPLDSTPVSGELTPYLPEGWGAIIDTDVDGPSSHPLRIDRENPNLGRYSACRRVTRTVFIGSAASVAAQRVRGVEEVRVRLGCAQPGETPATFGDALRRLNEQLAYLYSDGSRYWFDNHPNLNRLAADRAAQCKPEEVEHEIVARLGKDKARGDLAGVHVAPEGSAEVPDEQEARLVILGPKHTHFGTKQSHAARQDDTPALREARAVLESRGTGPRLYKNMVVFLSPDRDRLAELDQAVRLYLAWRSIDSEKEQLNLDAFQRKQAGTSVGRADETSAARLQETFCWLLVPSQERDGAGAVQWDVSKVGTGDGTLAQRASKKLRASEQLIVEWSPALLKMQLDELLWKDARHLDLKRLRECLCSYLYLPRLRDVNVLLGAVKAGVRSRDFFGFASGVGEDGRYLGLRLGETVDSFPLDGHSVLVRPDVAARQIEEDEARRAAAARDTGEARVTPYGDGAGASAKAGGSATGAGRGAVGPAGVPGATSPPGGTGAAVAVRPRRFHGAATLAPTRLGRDAGDIATEIVQHLTGLVGTNVEITLEIHAQIPDGAPENVVRTVLENCRTLKFRSFGFEEE